MKTYLNRTFTNESQTSGSGFREIHSFFIFVFPKKTMSYTLTSLNYLVKTSPVISTDFTRTKDEQENKPMQEPRGEEEGEGLNQRMRDILKTRQSEGRHQFMHKALQKWLAAPYRFQRATSAFLNNVTWHTELTKKHPNSSSNIIILICPSRMRGRVSSGRFLGRMHLGVINAAVAENCLMDDLISTVMQIPTMNHFKQEVTHYFDLRGTPSLRKALAKFLTRQLQGKWQGKDR